MTLATTGPDGQPHAAPVYFAADEALRLYFFSGEDSRHGQDLAADPRLAAAIYPECFGWQAIRGLQLRGTARPVPPGAEWEAGWQCYTTKFPFVVEMKEAVASTRLYIFVPQWVRLVDNRQGFGFKQEWDLRE
jgi:uncharacterized protein YhbP (UPF0306 family)